MSLLAWIPFNNSISNYGLNDMPLQAGIPSFSDGGKVTSHCLQVATTGSALKYTALPNDISYTICGWFLVKAYSSYNTLFCNGTDVSKGFFVRCNGGIENLQATVFGTAITYTSFKASTWFHVALVIDCKNKKFSYYINGNLVDIKTYTQNELYTAGGFNIGKLRDTYYPLNGLINDVRIYDECLSPKQIKELSKGLCLHYKLSRGGENLLFDTQTSSWLTAPYTYVNSTTDSSSTKTMYTNNCTVQNEKTYTISFLAKKNESANLMFYIYDSSTKLTTHKINVGANWEEVKINYTATLNSSTIRFRISNYSVANSELKTIGIKNIKLEEGDHATSWIPNKSDPEYKKLGYDTTEYDCSGYGNDGIIKGNIVYSNNTPRYEGSNQFNGTDSWIIGSNNIFSIKDSITLSFWAYRDDWSTWWTDSGSQQTAMVSAIQGGGIGICKSSATNLVFNCGSNDNGSNSYIYASVTLTPTSGWHQFAVTFDGLVTKGYVDGELVKSSTALTSKREIFWNVKTGFFIGGEASSSATTPNPLFKGNISDVRVYATALSADDVKALYNNPISIDNNKNLHCKEFTETSGFSFGKNGVVKHPEADLISMNSKLGIKDIQED